MKNYNIIAQSRDCSQTVNQEAVLEFLKEKLNYKLSPVQGSDNKFWIHGKRIGDKFSMFLEGSKYYQLIVREFSFGISASGDFNSWNIANHIRKEMKEAI